MRCFWLRKMCATWERTLHVATLVLRTVSGMGLPLGFLRWTWRIRKADLVGGTGDGAYGPCGVSGCGRCVWERTLHVATLVLRTVSGMGLPLGFPRLGRFARPILVVARVIAHGAVFRGNVCNLGADLACVGLARSRAPWDSQGRSWWWHE